MMDLKPPIGMRIGAALLALSALGMLAAPLTIIAAIPDLTTRSSRHALAGALGLTALALLEFLLALFPVRRGEGWALVAAVIPFLVVGVPIFIVDATNVAPARLWNTLLPQAVGLVVGFAAWTLCVISSIKRR